MQDSFCDMEGKVTAPEMVPVTETETSSVASEMTGNDVLLSNFVEQEESSIKEPRKRQLSEWTNEKHSLFLKSIEASFVDQLYNSSDMQSRQRQQHSSFDSVSGQFKVLQGGFWSKKNFRKENSKLKDSGRPLVSPGNTWIQHFTNGSRYGAAAHQGRPSSTVTSLQYPAPDPQLCRQESCCGNTEVTDQNFVEEHSTAEKGNKSRSRKRPRSQSSVIAHSINNDQVVPFHAFPTTQIPDHYVSPKK